MKTCFPETRFRFPGLIFLLAILMETETCFQEVAGKLMFSKKVGNIDILIFLDRNYFALFLTHTYAS